MTSDIVAPKRHGLAVLADTIVAPIAAFASLRLRPTWVWAFLLTSVLGMIGGYLQIPAGEHAAQYIFAHDPRFSTMPPDQVQSAKQVALVIQRFIWIAWPLVTIIGVLFATLFLLVGNAIGKGTANFAKLFALAANVGFLQYGLGYLLIGVIVAIRGGDAFSTQLDLIGALPNLGMLVPGPNAVHTFFTSFGVMQLWSLALLALGLRAIAGVKPAIAWGVPILMEVVGALYLASTVH